MKIYLVPFLLDFILFMVQLRLADAAGREMNLSNAQATCLLVAFSVAYMIVCPFVGRALNARSTRPILLFAIAAILVLGVPLLWTTQFWSALALMSALGAAAALAFNAFQSLMRGRTDEGALGATVAKYNISWSLGIGLGFLLGGVLKTLGQPLWLSLACAAAVAVVWWMIWSEKPVSAPIFAEENALSSTRNEAQNAMESRDNEVLGNEMRYVAIAWSLCLAANFVQRPLVTFVTKFSAQNHHDAWVAGTLLCALLWAQIAGAWLGYSRPQWLRRAQPVALLQIGIALALGGLWWASGSYVLSLCFMAMLGVLHGLAFFFAVFYCSDSVRSARNVGVNEMMVGVGNISGMIVCNMAIRWTSDFAFYPATIAFSLLILIAQMAWLRTSRRKYARTVVVAS